MKTIDWEKFAEINNLTPEEFMHQILAAAACVGAVYLDQNDTGEAEALKFACTDDVGKIEVYIRRLNT